MQDQNAATGPAGAGRARSGEEFLTQRAYALRRGVSHTAVQKAIKVGRLNKCLRRRSKGRGVLIDPVIADVEWEELTDKSQQRDHPAGGRPPAEPENPGPLFTGEPIPTPKPPDQADEGAGPEFQRWRTKREKNAALLKEIELHEARGVAGDLTVMERETYGLWRKLRDRLLDGLPDEVAPHFAALSDAKEIHLILVQKIRKVLDEFVAREAPPQRS